LYNHPFHKVDTHTLQIKQVPLCSTAWKGMPFFPAPRHWTMVCIRFRSSRRVNQSSAGTSKRLRCTAAQRAHVEVAAAAGQRDIRVTTQTHSGTHGPWGHYTGSYWDSQTSGSLHRPIEAYVVQYRTVGQWVDLTDRISADQTRYRPNLGADFKEYGILLESVPTWYRSGTKVIPKRVIGPTYSR